MVKQGSSSSNAAGQNRSVRLSLEEIQGYRERSLHLASPLKADQLLAYLDNPQGGALFCQNSLDVLPRLPKDSFDLVFVDPPYNMNKRFNDYVFYQKESRDWLEWALVWLLEIKRLLKPGGTLYVCSEWRTSGPLFQALEDHFVIHNRITWEREKGRSSSTNWKNASEDIWYCSKEGAKPYYDAGAVRLRRRVLAPYRQEGQAKDWQEHKGLRYRDTGASNLWTDLTVPFWSMPENTPHPTQKPEKLLARLLLASTRPGDLILDPFGGSGTTAVSAFKLKRRWICIEQDPAYCAYTQARLDSALENPHIQGYEDGVFYDRNFHAPASGKAKYDLGENSGEQEC